MNIAFIASLMMTFTPAQQEVMDHWLDTDTYADYTNDGITNLADFAIAADTDRLLSEGVVWGRDDAAFKHNLWIYICEASQRLTEIDAETMQYQLLSQQVDGWSEVYNQLDVNGQVQ
jgi:hypothetical protein